MRNQLILSAAVAAVVALLVTLASKPETETQPPESIEPTQSAERSSSTLRPTAHPRQGPRTKGTSTSREASPEGADAMLNRRIEAAARARGWTGGEEEADEALLELVGQLVRDEMTLAREEAQERRVQRHAERRAAMVADFVAKHPLGAEDEGRLSDLMTQEQEEITDLFRQAREDGSWHGARDEAAAIRGETDEALGEILDEEQMESWQEVREDSRPGHSGRSGHRERRP